MSLRARLITAFVVAVALPVVVAAAVLAVALPRSARNATDARVASARAQVEANLQAVCARQRALATTLADSTGDPAGAVATATAQPGSAAAIYTSATGAPLADAAHAGTDRTAILAALRDAPDCASVGGVGGPRLVAARVDRPAGGVAVVARALDPSLAGAGQGLLQTLVEGSGADLTITFPVVAGAQPPTATSITDQTRAAQLAARALSGIAPAALSHADGTTLEVVPLAGGTKLVVSKPDAQARLIVLLVAVIALVVLALTALVAWRIARAAARPLRALSHAADRVTAGDLDTRLPVDGSDEVARLAHAFNTMTEALRRTISDLRTSRDELQRTVSRLGDTLSSTHDLDRILGVIVDTAMVSVRATAGALLLTSAAGDALYLRVGRGLEGRLDDLPPGQPAANRRVRLYWRRGMPGVVAQVAVTGEPVRGAIGPTGHVVAADEPQGASVLALPLRSGGRVTGVLALYDRSDALPFDDRDVKIVASFVAQAVTAVDNVLLHQEAQRLSITDGLTGLWNYRYAVLALTREVERASRFGRPLSVLMLDLDRFKRVNDRYGHQRGDAVLLEVANRVRTVVREVDILARYGGEELILILPETDLTGATFLAERIGEALRERAMGAPGEEPLVMTASIGIAVFPQHGDSARTLLRAADGALYAAKAAGRDCHRVAGLSDGLVNAAREAGR